MSLVENIVSFVRGGAHDPAKKLVYGPVNLVEGWQYSRAPVGSGEKYFRIYIQEMWLRWSREYLAQYRPMVYTVVELHFGDQDLQLAFVAGEFKFGQHDFSQLQDALLLNYPITGPLPFNGGTVTLSAALVGLKTGDVLAGAVKVMSSFADVVGAPQLSAVMTVARPLAEGLDALLSPAQQFHLGLHDTFAQGSQQQLSAGYFAVLDADASLSVKDLLVIDGRLTYARDRAPVRDHNYMLFRVETFSERDDYKSLRTIFGPLDEAENTAMNGSVPQAQPLLKTAQLAAWRSADLTTADQRRFPAYLQQQFSEFLVAFRLQNLEAPTVTPTHVGPPVVGTQPAQIDAPNVITENDVADGLRQTMDVEDALRLSHVDVGASLLES